jgi:seryl-tRNA synthetase
MGAIEQDCPTTVPLGSLVDCGYLSNFPHHAMFVSHAHRNYPDIRFLGTLSLSSNVPDINQRLESPHALLSPTVCYHCFQAFNGKTLPSNELLFTATAKCHRHEFKQVVGLERLNTFTMRELVFFGSKEYVASRISTIQTLIKSLFESWGLHFRIIGANDPFFASSASNKRTFQSLFSLKQELQVRLPYKDKWLAVGSLNNHVTGLVKAFAIKPAGESEPADLHSGCVGIGFERLALGIFAQFGLDASQWPEALVKEL